MVARPLFQTSHQKRHENYTRPASPGLLPSWAGGGLLDSAESATLYASPGRHAGQGAGGALEVHHLAVGCLQGGSETATDCPGAMCRTAQNRQLAV